MRLPASRLRSFTPKSRRFYPSFLFPRDWLESLLGIVVQPLGPGPVFVQLTNVVVGVSVGFNGLVLRRRWGDAARPIDQIPVAGATPVATGVTCGSCGSRPD